MKHSLRHRVIAIVATAMIVGLTVLGLSFTPVGTAALAWYGCLTQGICI
jgi:hypothetical protein